MIHHRLGNQRKPQYPIPETRFDGSAGGNYSIEWIAGFSVGGTTTVVATVTGPIPEKLFVNVEVTQN